jgi:hypothetical protein
MEISDGIIAICSYDSLWRDLVTIFIIIIIIIIINALYLLLAVIIIIIIIIILISKQLHEAESLRSQ